MKHAVSISLGSSERDKKASITFKDQAITLERIGTDGDTAKFRQVFADLDSKIDAFGVGGVDLYLHFDQRAYPLHAALKLVEHVQKTPMVDGSGLKRTLERRLFELALPALGTLPHYRRAFIPMALDRSGIVQAVLEVSDEVIFGDLMFGLGLPIPIRSLRHYRVVQCVMLPIVSHFPLSWLFYGGKTMESEPKYEAYWRQADLIAGDFLFINKHMPLDMQGKTVITNTTTDANVTMLRERGVVRLITTTPRYEGRSFGTNMMEAALTAYAGKGRPLTLNELNELIDMLELKPNVQALE